MAHELQFLFLHEITQEQPTGEVPKHDPIPLLILFLDPPNRVCCKVLRNPLAPSLRPPTYAMMRTVGAKPSRHATSIASDPVDAVLVAITLKAKEDNCLSSRRTCPGGRRGVLGWDF
jgi:hypothetical protein